MEKTEKSCEVIYLIEKGSSMRFKRIGKMLLILLSLTYISVIVHELGHYLTALFFGIDGTIDLHLFSNSYFRFKRLPDNVNVYRLILINGSLFAGLFGFALILIDYKIKTDYLIGGGYSIVVGNCIYWMMVFDGSNDAYLFITTFDSYNYALHFTIIFFILILITVLFIRYIINHEKAN